jgi:aminopeptidase N
MGAMENKGLNIFNSVYVLARPDTATDLDYEHIESVIAHEYFHNWTGNRVTCRDWFQLSLKEGLTIFRDQEFSADMTSPATERISDVQALRGRQFAEDAGPMAHSVRPDSYIEMNNFYTATVYNKGAEVVRMYQALFGHEGFRRGMDLYFERHDGGAVTCIDFRAAMADANDADLAQFENWYMQAGTPRLYVDMDWDGDAGTATVRFRQECPPTPGQDEKQPFLIPVGLGLLDVEGNDLALMLEGEGETLKAGTRVLRVTEEQQDFTFVNLPPGPEAPVLSVLRNFSAPVEVVRDVPREELAFLMACDNDSFNRWEAGQKLARLVIEELMEQAADGADLRVDPVFLDAFRATLMDAGLEPRLKVSAMTLPSEAYLAEHMTPADPGAIHAARVYLLDTISREMEADLLATYEALKPTTPYRFEKGEVTRRFLKNACLTYLSRLPGDESLALLQGQFTDADNMTDSIAALYCLCSRDEPAREEAIGSFYSKWKGDALVIDKWFNVQAQADREGVLDDVRSLLDHPDFNVANPNRVRSLVSAFCVNLAHFHDATGAGYAFLADRVLELNQKNPQLASRMVDPLLSWKRYESGRAALMRGSLQRIADAGELSPNVFEKITKALQT